MPTLGDLYRESPHAARSAVDQHLLSVLNLRLIPEEIQRGTCPASKGSGFLIGYIGGHSYQRPIFWPAYVLGISAKNAAANAKNSVSWLEQRHILAHRLNFSGYFCPQNRYPGSSNAKHQSGQRPESFRHKGKASGVHIA